MERWRFILASSADLRVHIAELQQARQGQVQSVLNSAGALSFTYPMRDDLADEIKEIQTAVKAYRYSSSTGTWTCKWSGPVWTIDESFHDERMTVNCVGWQQLLEKRLLRLDKNYDDTDDGDIIQDLLAEANKLVLPDIGGYNVPVPYTYPATPTGIGWGGKIPNEGIGGATAYTNAIRDKTYTKHSSILAAMQELIDLENGCDISIDPELRLMYVRRKRRRITSQVFAYGWGPANLAQFQRQLDASTVANLVHVTGKPGTTPQYADTSAGFAGWNLGPGGTADPSPDTRQSFGLLEEVVALSDVADSAVLAAYAAGEVLFRYRPRVVYNITPFQYTAGSSIPEPFEDYTIGDQVYLTAILPPRVSIQNQAVRVFGISVSIDDNGNESISSLQVAPS